MFIEILISMLLISLMLLGVSAQQFASLHATQSQLYSMLAQQQMHNIEAILEATHGVDEELIHHWQETTSVLLPAGLASVSGNYPHFKIAIKWGVTECNNDIQGKSGCINSEVSL